MANFFFAKFSLSGCCPGPLSPEFVDGRAVFWNMSEIERLIPVGRRGGWRGGDRQSILKTSTGCGTCPAGARRAHAYMKRWLISDSVRGAELGLVSISLVIIPLDYAEDLPFVGPAPILKQRQPVSGNERPSPLGEGADQALQPSPPPCFPPKPCDLQSRDPESLGSMTSQPPPPTLATSSSFSLDAAARASESSAGCASP